jgi:hypothetical protein
MVEILAACCFPTDLISLRHNGAGFLPMSILTDAEWSRLQASHALTGVEKRQFVSVKATHNLATMSASKRHKIAAFWERIARTEAICRSLPGTIVQLYHGTLINKTCQLFRVLRLWVRPREWAAIAVGLISAVVVRVFVAKP